MHRYTLKFDSKNIVKLPMCLCLAILCISILSFNGCEHADAPPPTPAIVARSSGEQFELRELAPIPETRFRRWKLDFNTADESVCRISCSDLARLIVKGHLVENHETIFINSNPTIETLADPDEIDYVRLDTMGNVEIALPPQWVVNPILNNFTSTMIQFHLAGKVGVGSCDLGKTWELSIDSIYDIKIIR